MVRIVAQGATEQELAAILAAYEVLWPKPAPAAEVPTAPTACRFSGRWGHSEGFRTPRGGARAEARPGR